MSNPWMKFYPSDWQSDERLRMCSLTARGLWIEMLAIMHKSEARTDLVINAKAVTPQQLSVLVGADPETVEKCLSELEDAGVFSTRRNGVIYSRRLERDEIKSRKNRDNGKKGGNPKLSKQRENQHSVNPSDNTGVKAQKPEARSQSPEEEKESTSTDVRETRAREESQSDDGGGLGFGSAERDNEPEYAFHGKVIRLNSKDLALWKKRYHGLLDIEAELFTLDGYYATRDPDGGKNWFHRTQSNLLKRHNEALSAERSRQRQKTDEWGDPF